MKTKQKTTGKVEILIAEDSPTQAAQLAHLLEQHGYLVTVAVNGRKALDLLAQRKPTLVISDIVMPELDGYGLCKAIKTDEKLRDIPVMLVTTLSDAQDVIRGLECGADNFLRKPYDERYLLSRIDYLLMNLELRKHQKMQLGMEVDLGGHKHFINSERQQILDLLISTYEQAVQINSELKQREKELEHLNEHLEVLVQERTAELEAEIVERKRIEKEQARLVAIIEATPDMVATGSVDGFHPLYCNQAGLHMLGFETGQNFSNMNIYRMYPDRVSTMVREQAIPHAIEHGTWSGETALLGRDGREIPVSQVFIAHKGPDGSLEYLSTIARDITLQKENEKRITRQNRMYAVLSGINTTIVRTRDRQELFDDACRIAVEQGKFRLAWIGLVDANGLDVTPVARAGDDECHLDNIQLTARDDAPGRCEMVARVLREKTAVVCKNIATDPQMARWRDEALRRGYRSVIVLPLQLADKVTGLLLLYAEETGFFDTQEMRLLTEITGDISFALDHLEKEDRINYLAYYDALTGLANRSLFLERLAQYKRSAVSGGHQLALFMIDLERFKSINDSLGRPAGDALLRQVAQWLTDNAAQDASLLAHVGADHFALVMPVVRQGGNLMRLLDKWTEAFQNYPFRLNDAVFRIAAKVGVALFPDDGADAETLFRNAEVALEKAKASGEHYLFYASTMNAAVASKLTLENKLRRALERDELVLYYQPKIDLKTRRISGLEALMRWNDPDTGLLVPPIEFIPLLEETGLILEAGRWALEQAIADSARWKGMGLQVPRIAVNVSAIQLRQKNFVATVERALRGAKDIDGVLELEITESLIMQDIDANIEKLRAIRDMGVEISVDDFGTGYSSLSYISRLPINTLKIDRAFIINMTRKPDDQSIVSTIISLGHALKLKVIAEGVETEEQANLLRLLQCDEFQGYLFSRPVPVEDMDLLLLEGKTPAA